MVAPLLRSHHDSSHKQSCLFFKVAKSKESVYRPNAPAHQAAGWWAGQADAETGSKTETYRTQKNRYIFSKEWMEDTAQILRTEESQEPLLGRQEKIAKETMGPDSPMECLESN